MQTPSLSAEPAQNNTVVEIDDTSKQSTCPSCGCKSIYDDAIGDGEAVSRCMTGSGGCGTNYRFRTADGVLLKATEPQIRSKAESVLSGIKARLLGRVEAAKAIRGDERRASPEDGGKGASPYLDNGKQLRNLINPDIAKTYDGNTGDEDLDRKIGGMALRKVTGKSVADRLKERGFSIADAVANCSSEVNLRRWFETGHTEVSYADWCQKRIVCPNCAKARGGRAIGRWIPKIITILRESGQIPWMINLTVKNGPNLLERIEHLRKACTIINNRRREFARGRSRKVRVFNAIHGALMCLEIKRGSGSGLWHPHCHGLALLEPGARIDPEAASAEWLEVTGDSCNVMCKPTRFGEMLINTGMSVEEALEAPVESDKDFEQTGMDLLKSDLSELIKYSMKFDMDTTADDVIDAYIATRGMRLATSWGTLYKLKPADDLKEVGCDLTGSGEYIDHIYKWCKEAERYDLRGTARGIAVESDSEVVDGPASVGDRSREILRQQIVNEKKQDWYRQPE